MIHLLNFITENIYYELLVSILDLMSLSGEDFKDSSLTTLYNLESS